MNKIVLSLALLLSFINCHAIDDYLDIRHAINKNFINGNYKEVIYTYKENENSIDKFEDYIKLNIYRVIFLTYQKLNEFKELSEFLKNKQSYFDIGVYNELVSCVDFNNIPHDSIWQVYTKNALVEILDGTINPDTIIAIQLNEIRTVDQFYRGLSGFEELEYCAINSKIKDSLLVKKIDNITVYYDSINYDKVIKIINKIGFPTEPQYQGLTRGVFLTLQHSPDKKSFAQNYGLVYDAWKQKKISNHDFTLFYDRCLRFNGCPQFYATQYIKEKIEGIETGKIILAPVELPDDLKTINIRRKSLGLNILTTKEFKF